MSLPPPKKKVKLTIISVVDYFMPSAKFQVKNHLFMKRSDTFQFQYLSDHSTWLLIGSLVRDSRDIV